MSTPPNPAAQPADDESLAVEAEEVEELSVASHTMGLAALSGTKIVNFDDETLGTVADLMFDMDNGRLTYAVMSSGGFLGLGEKHFAIPWGVLEIDRVRRCLVLDADAATFHKSPGFNPGRWSESQPSDSSWQDRLHLHYKSKSAGVVADLKRRS